MPPSGPFEEDYESEVTQVVINSRRYSIMLPRRLEPLVNPLDPVGEFPLWAKIWHASIILSEWVARLKPDPQKTLLEIGGGLGLTSIVAASYGHRITYSEGNPDALRFAKASAGLNPGGQFQLIAHDWNHPGRIGRFDMMLGSEVVYRETDIPLLIKVIDTCLAPGGQIILTGEIRRTTEKFFGLMSKTYEISAQRKQLTSENEVYTIGLFRLRAKQPS